MKMAHEQYAKREYEMYTYLDAIDKPEIENLGFCSIYYFGKWNDDYMLMAMTLLTDGDLDDKAEEGFFKDSIENQAINSLILFRNFVSMHLFITWKLLHQFALICVYIYILIGSTIEVHACSRYKARRHQTRKHYVEGKK